MSVGSSAVVVVILKGKCCMVQTGGHTAYVGPAETFSSLARELHCQYNNTGPQDVSYYLNQLINYNPQIPPDAQNIMHGVVLCVVN